MNLPPRTVERLSKYRRLLEQTVSHDDAYFFSHHLAKRLNLTPVQVRRDLMLIGLSGNHRKGYSVKELIQLIGKTIDRDKAHKLAIVGMGNLGQAVARFIRKKGTRMEIVAGFDIDSTKANTEFEGVPCFDAGTLTESIKQLKIDIVVLTTSAESAQKTVDIVVNAGVKGILNFTSVNLDVASNVYLKNYDIMTSLEEIGFFIHNPVEPPK